MTVALFIVHKYDDKVSIKSPITRKRIKIATVIPPNFYGVRMQEKRFEKAPDVAYFYLHSYME
jgi:hypothetical protein